MRTIKLFAAALVIASVALSPGAAFAGKKAQAGANRPATAAHGRHGPDGVVGLRRSARCCGCARRRNSLATSTSP